MTFSDSNMDLAFPANESTYAYSPFYELASLLKSMPRSSNEKHSFFRKKTLHLSLFLTT